MRNREDLATIAEKEALRPYHGNVMTLKSNLSPIINLFPKWNLKAAENKWCAAFVYYCCVECGYNLPYKLEHPKIGFSFAGCGGWDDWAKLKKFFISSRSAGFNPERGDIILYDRVFDPGPHDHIGIILRNETDSLIVTEGNVNNLVYYN
jgi:hypothetical protein